MSCEPILHITGKAEWAAALEQGSYKADSLAAQGFIHCSKPEQVLRVANSFYAGRQDLVLLVIDPSRLGSTLRWEPGDDLQTQLFPHIYGPLNLDVVTSVIDFPPAEGGSFTLPEELAC